MRALETGKKQGGHCGEYSYSHSNFLPGFSCGRYCSISWNVLLSGWQHPVDAVTTSLVACNPSVRFVREALRDQGIESLRLANAPQRPLPTLGSDVWIAQNVTLMRGIHVGDGAIVAAGAVVTKDVPPYAIVGGSPARLIRWRFPEQIRSALIEMQWWRYKLSDFADLDLGDAATFVKEFERRRASLEIWEPAAPLFLDELQNAGSGK